MNRVMFLDPWTDGNIASKFRSNLGPVSNKRAGSTQHSQRHTRKQWIFNKSVVDAPLRPTARTRSFVGIGI